MILQDTINIGVFLMITLIALISYIYQRRQAHALDEVNDAAQRWLEIQIKDRRAKRTADAQSIDPVPWLNSMSTLLMPGIELREVARVIQDSRAVELLTADGRKLIVTPLGLNDLKRRDRAMQASGKDRLADFAARPLLSSRRIQSGRLTLAENEWLDIESARAGDMLGVGWGAPDRLYFHLVG